MLLLELFVRILTAADQFYSQTNEYRFVVEKAALEQISCPCIQLSLSVCSHHSSIFMFHPSNTDNIGLILGNDSIREEVQTKRFISCLLHVATFGKAVIRQLRI